MTATTLSNLWNPEQGQNVLSLCQERDGFIDFSLTLALQFSELEVGCMVFQSVARDRKVDESTQSVEGFSQARR